VFKVKLYIDPAKMREAVLGKAEFPKVLGVRMYHPLEKLHLLPFNTIQIMGYNYKTTAHEPIETSKLEGWVSKIRKYGKLVIGEVWTPQQTDRVEIAKRLAQADVDMITVQEQFGQYGMTTEQFNEIAEEARAVKSDVYVGLVEAEYTQLDTAMGHYPEKKEKARADYIGCGCWRDFETNKTIINILRIRARQYGMYAFVADIDFADPYKTTYDPATFQDTAMLGYNMLDGITTWGVVEEWPWRDRWHNVLETFANIRKGAVNVPMWRNKTVKANTVEYGLWLTIPTQNFSITIHNTTAASYEFLISFDLGGSWISMGRPISGPGLQQMPVEWWRMPLPATITINCEQGPADGILNGWIMYKET
jgi:hypothetical protein